VTTKEQVGGEKKTGESSSTEQSPAPSRQASAASTPSASTSATTTTTKKSPAEEKKEQQEAPAKPVFSGFTFNFPSATGSAATTTTSGDSAPKFSFSWGAPASTTTTGASQTTESKPAASGFSFNWAAPAAATSTTGASSGTSAFPTGGFTFSFKPKPAEEDEEEGEEGGEEHNVEIKEGEGIVKLEQKEMQSGEEEEDIILQARAKLYAFIKIEDDAKFRELGIGDLHLNRHKETKKVRLVMRAEKTLRLLLNCAVFPEMNVSVGEDKLLRFVAVPSPGSVFDGMDISKPVAYAIKFRQVEDATTFKAKLEDLGAKPKA
jgi:Ran-binding protein 1